MKRQISSERERGGGNVTEDWVGAYDQFLDNIKWRYGTRLIIHIADAPAHGREWCNVDNHNEENLKLYPKIQKCIDKNIKIIAIQIGDYPKPSFSKFKTEYESKGGILYKIKVFNKFMSN